jgi:hypothetical protein
MWATLVLVLVALSFWLLYRFSQAVFILFIAFLALGLPERPHLSLWRFIERFSLPAKRSAAKNGRLNRPR